MKMNIYIKKRRRKKKVSAKHTWQYLNDKNKPVRFLVNLRPISIVPLDISAFYKTFNCENP